MRRSLNLVERWNLKMANLENQFPQGSAGSNPALRVLFSFSTFD